MKALLKQKPEVGIWMDDIPMPVIGHNDVLIKIETTAICGTDLHIYQWDDWAERTLPIPLVIGHEFAGTITQLGSEVTGLNIGDRVSGEGHITCGHCRNCRAGRRHLCHHTLGVGVTRPGCFAEYLSLPASNIFKLPPSINNTLGALLDPLGNATHAALSFDLVGEDVLITGAGPIGIMAAVICTHVGARHIVITDINDYRLQLAQDMGIKNAININQTSITSLKHELGMIEGFDVGLEMSGHPEAFGSLFAHMSHGGRIALVGIPPKPVAIDWNMVIFKGLQIKGIYGREMFETWYKQTSMLDSGLNITPIITHHYPIDQFQAGFDTMLSGRSGKVILNWTD